MIERRILLEENDDIEQIELHRDDIKPEQMNANVNDPPENLIGEDDVTFYFVLLQ